MFNSAQPSALRCAFCRIYYLIPSYPVLYKTEVRPAMLYGLEAVPLIKKQEAELAVAELKMLRFSLGVTRMDKIKNEFIRGTAQVRRIGDKVRETRLRWCGHVQRQNAEYIGKKDVELGAAR